LEVLILKDFKSFAPEVLILMDFKSLFPEVLILGGLKSFIMSELQKSAKYLEVLIMEGLRRFFDKARKLGAGFGAAAGMNFRPSGNMNRSEDCTTC
jgi:hypothetical protein